MPTLHSLVSSYLPDCGLLEIALPSQNGRLLELHAHSADFPLTHMVVERFQGSEAVNSLYSLRIDILTAWANFAPTALLGHELSLALLQADGSHRQWHGLVTQCSALGGDGGLARFRLTLQPWLKQLDQQRNNAVYTNQTTLEIISDVFATYPIANYAIENTAELPVYPTRVQYRESDLNFVLRLLAEEGLNYRFEHDQGAASDSPSRHKLIIFDANSTLPDCPLNPIRFHRKDATEKTDSMQYWVSRRQVISNHVQVGSWNADLLLALQANQPSALNLGDQPVLETYQLYGSQRFATNAQATAAALLEIRRHEQLAKQFDAQGSVRCLAPGQRFALSQHERYHSAQSRRLYVAISVQHDAVNNLGANAATLLQLADVEKGTYSNVVLAQDAATAIVPPFIPKPIAPEMMNALVVDAHNPESPNTHVHSERNHRVKVRFFWQPKTQHDRAHTPAVSIPSRRPASAQTSVWLRVQSPLAGPDWGVHLLPRIGSEVVLDFVEGDIDRPVVARQLHNAQDTPPWPAGHNAVANHPGTLSGWHSRTLDGSGYNQWQVDDTPQQLRMRLASSYAHSQLNLGHLNALRPDSSLRSVWRGTGAELRSDAWTVVRTGGGLLVSTASQPDAAGVMLETSSLQGQLQAAGETAKRMQTALQQAANVPLEGNALFEPLLQAIDPQQNGLYAETVNGQKTVQPLPGQRDGTKPVHRFDRPLVVLDAINSLNIATPASIAFFAGDCLHWTSQNDVHIAARQTVSMAAAGSVGLHTADKDINIIAQHSPISVQSHDGEQHWTAQQNVQITSSNGSIDVHAQGKITLNGGDTSIVLEGENIILYMPGALDIKGSRHAFVGPGGNTVSLPALPLARTSISIRESPLFINHDEQVVYQDGLQQSVDGRLRYHVENTVESRQQQKGESLPEEKTNRLPTPEPDPIAKSLRYMQFSFTDD